MRYKRIYPALPLLSLLAFNNNAIANDEVPTAEYESMVITSSRSNLLQQEAPQIVTIITREQIEQQLAISTDSSQLLSNLLPAYSPSRQKLTGSGETFRGRAPLIMIDGVPQSNPVRATGRSVHTIDLAMVERIEVIHGANAIHGLGATGGIINYITRRPTAGSFNQHFGIQSTTPTSDLNSDTMGYKLNYRADGNSGNFDYLVGVSLEEQGLYLDGNGDPIGVDNVQGDLMDSQTYDLFTKFGYWIDDDQRLEFQVNRYVAEGNQNYVSVKGDRKNGVPTTSEEGTPEGMAPSNKVLTVNANYQNDDFFGMSLAIQAYHQKFEGLFGAVISKTFQDPAIAPDGTLWDQSKLESSKLGSKFTLVKDDLFDDRLKLTTGFDILQDNTEQSLALTNRVWVPEMSLFNYAPFLQAEVHVLDNLAFHTGVRYEHVEVDIGTYQAVASKNGVTINGGSPDFDETLLNLGVVYNPIESVRLFANYSEGFGMPDVGRVLKGLNTANQDIDQLLDLHPVITENKEIGIRFNQGAVDLELSYYLSTSDFGSRLEKVGDYYFLRREKTEIQGFEASAGFKFSEQQKLKLGYSRTRGEYDSDNDGSLDKKLSAFNISPDRLVGTLSSHWNEDFDTMLQANYAFDRSFDDPTKEFNGYLLVDASVAYKLPYGKVNLSIANLLDENYVTYYSQSAYAHDSRYFTGRGRTLTLGYSVDL